MLVVYHHNGTARIISAQYEPMTSLRVAVDSNDNLDGSLRSEEAEDIDVQQ